MQLAIPEGAYERIKVQQSDAERALELVKSWAIESQDDYEKAAEFLGQIKGKQKDFKAEKDALVRPLRDVVSRITDLFANPLGLLSEAEMHLKDELKRYQEESAKKHEQMLTDAQSPAEVAAAIEVLADKPAGISERVVWRWELVDADKVPKDYWILDEKRINLEARQHKGELCIPGIKPVADKTIVARAK